MKKAILFSTLLFSTFWAAAQNFELRLANAGNGLIAVEMRETSGKPPTSADIQTDLVFGICWDKSYGIDLGAVNSNYTIAKAGPETVSGGMEYQQFAKSPTPMNFPTSWGAGQWVKIMEVPNNLASNQATGSFSVCPTSIQELNINYNLVDYKVAPGEHATNVRIGSLLPKSLRLFAATLTTDEQEVELDWQTITDREYTHYELEHSLDGNVFRTFNTVQAKGGGDAGSVYTQQHKPVPGTTNYYRLKMVDTKGQIEYSPIRIIQLERLDDWTVTPNPSKGHFTLNLEAAQEEDIQMAVVDASGKTIFQDIVGVHPGQNNHPVHLDGVAAGMYQIKVRWSDGATQAKNLFIVE